MKILIVSATAFEQVGLINAIETHGIKKSFFEYAINDLSIFPLVTGVGSMHTAFALSRFQDIKNIDLAINIGVCGSFERDQKLGEVIEINKDRFADLGVEEKDGSFTDVYQMELDNGNRFPFEDGWIHNKSHKFVSDRNKKCGITLNKVNGQQSSIDLMREKYNPQVESMEGAAFLYACKAMDLKGIQLRSVSNYVEPRNRDNWKIEEALDNLNDFVFKYITQLSNPNP